LKIAKRTDMDGVPTLPDAAGLAGVPDMGLVKVGSLLVRPNRASGTVLVFFNGRITDARALRNDYFHRWSWHPAFRSTLVFLPDPFAGPATGLQLAWYVGTRDRDVLGELMTEVAAIRRAVAPDATTHCFGSSGGGFAAAAALLRGLCDSSLVVNPQTSVAAYHGQEPRRFARLYGRPLDALEDEDAVRLSLISRLSLGERREGGRLHYFQNVHDDHHLAHHMTPFARAVDSFPPGGASWLAIRLYGDKVAGHNAPGLEGTLAMFREGLPEALS